MRVIIPDIHADLPRLEASLAAAGGAPLAFLGDFIDGHGRGDDLAILCRVRALVDSGRAVAVMGNHELNAIRFHRLDSAGVPLRARSEANAAQHRTFLDTFGVGTSEALAWTDWFLTLPLWWQGDGTRLVHACWDDAAIATIAARRPDGRLAVHDLPDVRDKTCDFGRAVERLTTGIEADLPAPHFFVDLKGKRRMRVRLSWWDEGRTWQAAALSVPDPAILPASEVPAGELPPRYPLDAPPVFVGHYKLHGAPKVVHPRAICLDHPTVPCVYRWAGAGDLRDGDITVLLDGQDGGIQKSLASLPWLAIRSRPGTNGRNGARGWRQRAIRGSPPRSPSAGRCPKGRRWPGQPNSSPSVRRARCSSIARPTPRARALGRTGRNSTLMRRYCGRRFRTHPCVGRSCYWSITAGWR